MMRWYAVIRGANPGIYDSLEECKAQVDGYSCHYYRGFNSLDDAQEFLRDELGYLEYHIYTDGACKGNGRYGSIAGYGVYYGPNDSRNRHSRVNGNQTNQRAELSAIQSALLWCYDDANYQYDSRFVYVIHTDSQYSINCLTQWFRKWENNDYINSYGNDVANEDIIRDCRDSIDAIHNWGGSVKLRKVDAHSGNEWNDAADELANDACYLDY